MESFNKEMVCIFKEEKYSVRDNGAVYRHSINANKPRKYDNQWTFGKINFETGYLHIASVRVHSIIATAFHGVPPTQQHVVDHIDTNRHNNRPENLRWITRLEQVILNPITAKRIAIVCGSVEAFLEDPAKFRSKFKEPDVQWMRQVSKEEAQASYDRLMAWAKSDKLPIGGSLGEWVFRPKRHEHSHQLNSEAQGVLRIQSRTSNAVQQAWATPCEFPCCPNEAGTNPIATYVDRLKVGSLFCINGIYSSLVSKVALSADGNTVYVISHSTNTNAIKPWALASIHYEDNVFVHTGIRNFFSEQGAEKQFTLVQGLDWAGGDSIDDYS